MNYILIKDTITGKELKVVQPEFSNDFIVTNESTGEPVEIKARFIGKVIRTWMKERRKG